MELESQLKNLLMTLNISNGSRICMVPLTLSMLDISSVPINSVHVSITQILTGFLADEKHIINCHFFLKSEKTKSIFIFTWRIGLESKIFVQFIFFLTIETRTTQTQLVQKTAFPARESKNCTLLYFVA